MLRTASPESVRILVKEWEQVGPKDNPELDGFNFTDELARSDAQQLTRTGQIEFLELPTGLTISTFQYVGSVRVDNLRISILPKISGMPLLNLLRYAYNLRKLDVFQPVVFGTEKGDFQDLLIQQLGFESNELVQRGLYKKYERLKENLQSPRGRIDFSVFFLQGGTVKASLPCVHYLRLENNILNQVLLAGLKYSISLTNDLDLKTTLRQTANILQQEVSSVFLTSQLLLKAKLRIDRMTLAYTSALTIIQLLLESQGISIENEERKVRLPGFLFDMNRFFQALIDRFLKDNLEDYLVKSEYQLRNMIEYDPLHNPQHKNTLIPRPDFAIMHGKKVKALLDTKYRDLWETDLPREMLYQLALYAFSQDRPGQSTIIYPTMHTEAMESWLDISHPLSGEKLATVKLRPVNLYELEQVIVNGSISSKIAFAHKIAFG